MSSLMEGTAKERKDLSNACRVAIDGFHGTSNSVEVVDIVFQSESGFSEKIENAPAFVKDQEYKIRFKL
jgi:hypothetical protein